MANLESNRACIIKRFEGWPKQLDDCAVEELDEILGGPSLIKIPGKKTQPLFVSTLLHGNEHSGFKALQNLMRELGHSPPPRTLWVLIGNTAAAKQNLRMMPGELDYNRIWSDGSVDIYKAAQSVLDELKAANIFAAIDIHDNTGWNPHYACVANINGPSLQLAALFNHIAIHSTYPSTTLTDNVAAFAPAVTLECGRIDDPFGADRALRLLRAVLHLSELPNHQPRIQDLKLFRAAGRIMIEKSASIVVGALKAPKGGVSLRSDLDHLNFSQLKAGEAIGYCDNFAAVIEDFPEKSPGEKSFLAVENSQLIVARSFVPAMLTLNVSAIKADCLGYIMQEVPR